MATMMVACIKTALYAQLVQKFQKTGSIMGHGLAHNPTVQIYPTHPINGPLSYFEPYQSPLQVLQKYDLCPPPRPHPRMKPCWFCYKLTFLRCQLPVGSDAALHWCILRKYCTGRKEKNLDLKEKGSDLSNGRSCSRLSRFSRRREQGSSFRSQICFYSGRHCLIPDGLEAT